MRKTGQNTKQEKQHTKDPKKTKIEDNKQTKKAKGRG